MHWTTTEQGLPNWNFKALYVIFDGENVTKVRHINTYKNAKEAWDILKTTHERTTDV